MQRTLAVCELVVLVGMQVLVVWLCRGPGWMCWQGQLVHRQAVLLIGPCTLAHGCSNDQRAVQ